MRAHPLPLRLPAGERGTAAVEFALVAPLMLLLMFGFLELGRMLFDYQAINGGLRNAARYLSRVPVTCTAPGANNGTVDDPNHRTIALNLAYTGKATPAGPADRLVNYWDGGNLTVAIQCVSNAGPYFRAALVNRPNYPRIHLSADVPFPLLTGLPPFGGTTITLRVRHTEANFGG